MYRGGADLAHCQMHISSELEPAASASLHSALFIKYQDLKDRNRWKQVIIGDPGAHWGGAGVAHCQINIGSELEPATYNVFGCYFIDIDIL